MLKDLLSSYICVHDRPHVCVHVCVIDRELVRVWVRDDTEPVTMCPSPNPESMTMYEAVSVTIFESEPVREEINNGFFHQRMRREDRIFEDLQYTPT